LRTEKFIYLYRGPSTELTPEEGAERQAAYAAWTEKLGRAVEIFELLPMNLKYTARDRHR
jgi:hypothetical protein